jgi:hypothetical protein
MVQIFEKYNKPESFIRRSLDHIKFLKLLVLVAAHLSSFLMPFSLNGLYKVHIATFTSFCSCETCFIVIRVERTLR